MGVIFADIVRLPGEKRRDPDRFRPEVGQHLPHYAFMPFGGGPRICIGNHFALMEGQTILAQLSRTVRFESLTRHPIEPEPLITLRPKGRMWMRVHRRTDRDEQQAGGGPHP
jgi:cytochrome P450